LDFTRAQVNELLVFGEIAMKWVFTLVSLMLSISVMATEMKDSIDYALDRANNEKLEQKKDIDQIRNEAINCNPAGKESDAACDSYSKGEEPGE
jgi:hypothetical protein